MKISFNIPNNDWDHFVKEHPNGIVFQKPEMFKLFENTKKFEPMVIGIYESEKLKGILLGVFIYEKEGFAKQLSSRFVIYGGPLLIGSEDQQKKYLDTLLDTLIRSTRKKAIFIQFRNFCKQEHLLPVYEKHGFSSLDRLNYVVPVTSRDKVMQNLSESRRRQIKKALENGASIVIPKNTAQLREFYKILYKLYRNKIQKPLPDWSFFESFFSASKEGKLGLIRLVKYKDKIIGGIIAPVMENKCVYEWYVCGLDKQYKDQHPSVLATWAAIEYAIENNFTCFDFMGVGIPDKHYGVRDFKARFGGELVNYGRLTRINNQFLYGIAEFGYNILALFKKI